MQRTFGDVLADTAVASDFRAKSDLNRREHLGKKQRVNLPTLLEECWTRARPRALDGANAGKTVFTFQFKIDLADCTDFVPNLNDIELQLPKELKKMFNDNKRKNRIQVLPPPCHSPNIFNISLRYGEEKAIAKKNAEAVAKALLG